MKKVTLILCGVVALAACKRSVHDSGCITLKTGPVYNYVPLKTGQLDTIKSLFSANGLSSADLTFSYYFSDTLKDSTNTPYFNQQAGASLTINGLPVFNSTLNWDFHNGILYLPYTNNPGYPNPGDSTSHQTLPALRSLFFKTYEAALYTGNGPNRPPPTATPQLARPGAYYHDSCLVAQLGYIDAANQPNSGLSYGKKLIKVWEIYPEHTILTSLLYRSLSPMVFVIDETGFSWCPFPMYPGDPVLFTD
jgi:hypothetical protein